MQVAVCFSGTAMNLRNCVGGPDPTDPSPQNYLMQKLMVVHRLDLLGGADPTDIFS